MAKQTIPQLEKRAKAAWNTAIKLRDELEAKKMRTQLLPRMNAMIGATFRYANRYSSSDTWWLYIRIIGIAGDRYQTISIQRDVYGKASMVVEDHKTPDDNGQLGTGYDRISYDDYREGVRPIIDELLAAAKV